MSTDGVAPTSRRYSKAQKEQAVRLVRQLREETGEKHGAVQRVARQLGFGVETVRKWVKQADIDDGVRPGVTTDDNAKIRRLEQENRELRRANEILRSSTSPVRLPSRRAGRAPRRGCTR